MDGLKNSGLSCFLCRILIATMNKAITFVGVHNQEFGRITRSQSRAIALCESSAQTDLSKLTITKSLAKRGKSKLSLGDCSDVNGHSNIAMPMVIPSKRKQPLKHITSVHPKNITTINGLKRSRTSLAKLNTGKRSKSSSKAEVIDCGIPATRGLSSKKKTTLKDITNRVRNVANISHGDSFKDCRIATAQKVGYVSCPVQ